MRASSPSAWRALVLPLARSKYPDGLGFGGDGDDDDNDGPRDLRTPGIVPPPSLLLRYTTSIAIIISILLRYTTRLRFVDVFYTYVRSMIHRRDACVQVYCNCFFLFFAHVTAISLRI